MKNVDISRTQGASHRFTSFLATVNYVKVNQCDICIKYLKKAAPKRPIPIKVKKSDNLFSRSR